MVDILYSLIDLICLFILTIILCKVKVNPLYKKHKKLDEVVFCYLTTFSMIFCIGDAIWGTIASHYLPVSVYVFMGISYLLYFLVPVLCYLIFLYSEICCGLNFYKNKVLVILSIIPLLIDIVLLVVNPWFRTLFYVERNFNYISGDYLGYFIVCQFSYLLIVFVQICFVCIKERKKETKKKFSVIFLFVLALIVFAVLQYIFDHSPFTALGFMVAIFIIYIFNTTKEKEELLIHTHEAENLLKIENHKQIISAISNSYILMYIFDLKGGEPNRIKGSELIEQNVTRNTDPRSIFKDMLKLYVTSEYLEEMEVFANRASVAQRMGDENTISKIFMSKTIGWCKASWIRIKNDEKGVVDTAIFAIQDIDAEKRKEIEYQQRLKNALTNQNEIYTEMLRMQSNGMLATDMHNNIIMLNESAAKLFGFANSENVHVIDDILVKFENDNKDEIISKLHKIKINGGKYSFEFSVTDSNGSLIHVIADSKLTHMSNGDKVILTSFADITKNKKMERDLVILSETDALTGINNRGSGERKTEFLLSSKKQGMLCLLDADSFKSINDNFGHVVGDKVIIKIAECLKKTFRDRDIVMRLGGDEFAVFAVGIVEKEDAILCINRFFESLDEVKVPELKGRKISVSLGAIICNEEDKTFDDYYQRADKAMYNSKKFKGNHYEFFE